MDVVILGAGAHGQDMADDFMDRMADVWLTDDDEQRRIAARDRGFPVTAYKGAATHIGINDSRTRREVADRIGLHGYTATGPVGTWIHGDALYNRSFIGEHTHVNAGAFLTRCALGDFVTVGPNATICGDVTIGDDVMIGAGAVIRNLLTIGDGAVIGCGAVVVEDVPPGVTVVGNPARPIVRKPLQASCPQCGHSAPINADGTIGFHMRYMVSTSDGICPASNKAETMANAVMGSC